MSHLTIAYDSPAKKKNITGLLENALDREKKLLLIALKRTHQKLQNFENQYDLSSDEFFQLYNSGKTDDRDDYIDWAGEYHILSSIKEKIQEIEELTIEYH